MLPLNYNFAALFPILICSFDMLMGKQMILTILIITVTLGTEPELKLRIAFLSLSTDSAFMSRYFRIFLNIMFEFRSSFHLLRAKMHVVVASHPEYAKVQKRGGNCNHLKQGN